MSHLPLRSTTILLADDEPYNLRWLIDWIESENYSVTITESVDAAINELRGARYRTIVADLSIPLLSPQELPKENEPLHKTYPGLVLANYARHHDHTARQVVVYSVHDDPLIRAYANKLGFTYILKGRPRIMKHELQSILTYDPRSP